jgi:hypothetical protein
MPQKEVKQFQAMLPHISVSWPLCHQLGTPYTHPWT